MAIRPGRGRDERGVEQRIDQLEARDKRSRVRADFAMRRAYELMDIRMKPPR